MEQLETKLVELIDKLEAAGIQFAPEVLEAAKTAVFIDGIMQVALVGFLLLITTGIVTTFIILAIKFNDVDYRAGAIASTVIGCVIILLVASFSNPWLKVFAPEAALVKQLLL